MTEGAATRFLPLQCFDSQSRQFAETLHASFQEGDALYSHLSPERQQAFLHRLLSALHDAVTYQDSTPLRGVLHNLSDPPSSLLDNAAISPCLVVTRCNLVRRGIFAALRAGAAEGLSSTDLLEALNTATEALARAACLEMEQFEEKLHRRDAIFEAVGAAAEQFLSMTNLHFNIQNLLERLGTAARVSRVYVFENQAGADGDGDGALGMRRRYLWTASGLDSHLDSPALQNQSYQANEVSRWEAILQCGGAIYGPMETFPACEQELLRRGQVSALLVVPVFVDGQWWGFIGFDEIDTRRSWSYAEIDAVKTAAGIIGAAMQRYRVQEVLEKSEAELRKLYRAIEQSPVSIVITDTRGVIEYVNPRFTQTTGYTYMEAVGQTPHILKSGRTPRQVYQQLWKTIMAGREWQGEFQNRKKDGELYWEAASISPITNAHGAITHFVAVKEDITERKKIEQTLQEAMIEAEAGTRAKSTFLANMSHEIRTPLNVIVGTTTLLLQTLLTPEQQEFVEMSYTSSNALLTLINDVLDISKIEAGKIELFNQPFSLRDCIEESLDTLAAEASRKHLVLVYLLDEQLPPWLIGDVMRLRQVLTNLLTNAVRFTDVGEVVLSVTGHSLPPSPYLPAPAKASGDWPGSEANAARYEIHFAVRDTGIGIPHEALGLLFRPFSQVNSSTTRTYGGTGLGLAISKRLTEMMGGRIWVESKVGVGSTFHFTMVAAAAPPEEAVLPPDPRFQILAGKRLLIADDNPSSSRILTRQAQEWEMLPQTTSLTREALDWLQHCGPFDAAVLNMHAPEMDSMTLATAVQIAPNGRTLPLVVFISMDQQIEASREFEDHHVIFLSRPPKPFHLREALVSLLSGERGERTGSSSRSRLQRLKYGPPLHSTLSAAWHPLRILLAEDDAGNQRVTLSLLAHMEYHGVDVASDGQEVLARLERQPYDVVFMDVQMPHMDGFEATRRIRETFPADRQPWIIAMTAHAMQGDRERCLEAGMDDYISKPVRLAELETVLRKAPRSLDLSPMTSNDHDEERTISQTQTQTQTKEKRVQHDGDLFILPRSWSQLPSQLPSQPNGNSPGLPSIPAIVPPPCSSALTQSPFLLAFPASNGCSTHQNSANSCRPLGRAGRGLSPKLLISSSTICRTALPQLSRRWPKRIPAISRLPPIR
ncbi:MAG: response regulator [Chloroflexaceae bacterium]|nr:response regulator [Chloroflexaceae bacterium]